ncbi:hypothetical protein QR685DRAFT_542651 [Neurospora intermedia]|uniref:Uncharacterized protein n=1 Tax=Neurospora intermedia TaxID=5142 RepID=A0ABR3DF64_NEUIN
MNYAERLQEIWSLIPQQPEDNNTWDYVQGTLIMKFARTLIEQQEALDDQDRELSEKEQTLHEREKALRDREQALLNKEQAVQTREQNAQIREHDLHRREQAVKDKEHQLELHAKLDLILEKMDNNATKEQVQSVSDSVQNMATQEQANALSNSLNTMSPQVQAISDQMKQVGFVSESLQNVVQFMEGVSHMLHTVSGQLSQIWNDSSTKDLVWRGMSKLWDQLLEMSSVMNSQNRTRSETLELISSQISQVNNDKATKQQVESALTKLDTLSENGATQALVRSVSTTVGSVLAKFDGVASKENLKVLYGLYRHLALQLAAMANNHDLRLSDIESDLQNMWGWVENLCDGDTNSLAVVLKEKVERLEQELEDLKSTNFDLDNQIQDQCARLDELNEERVDDLLDKLDRFIVADTQEGPLEAIFNQFCLVMSDPDVRALNNLDFFNAGPPVDRWYCFKRIIHSGPTTDAIPHDGQCDMHDQCLQVKLCNTLSHFFDACKKRKASEDDRRHEDWKYLIQYRSGLPPVRTKAVWPDLAVEMRMEPPYGFPITKSLAIEVRNIHDHGDRHHDPLTRTLDKVWTNLERLRASEVFTGMGNRLVNRPPNPAGTSDSNAMDLDDAPAPPNAPVAPAGHGAPAGDVVPSGHVAQAGPVAPAGHGAPAGDVVPSGHVAQAGPVAPAGSVVPAGTIVPAVRVTPVQSQLDTDMAVNEEMTIVRFHMDSEDWDID